MRLFINCLLLCQHDIHDVIPGLKYLGECVEGDLIVEFTDVDDDDYDM